MFSLLILSFTDCVFGVISNKTLSNTKSEKFSSRTFIGLNFTCRSMIHAKLISWYKIWIIHIYIYMVYVSISCTIKIIYVSNYYSTICWKDHCFSTELPLYLCWKSVVDICVDLCLDLLFHWFVCLSLHQYHTVPTSVTL